MIDKLLRWPLWCLLAIPAVAQEVDIAALGSLQLSFVQAETVEVYPAQPLSAQVSFRSGDAFSLVAPGRVQQIDYRVEVGAAVAQGQPFAILRGPEMHHFQIEYEASKQMLEATRRRFNSNKALYERKAIRESQWIEVSEKYYAAQLEYEHLRHFYELVRSDTQDPDALTLVAPFAGLIDYDAKHGAIEAGESIARFIPQKSVRLEVALPNALRADIAYLQTDLCQLAVEQVGGMARGFFVSAWTETVKPECQLIPGQQLLVTPLLRARAYRVTQNSVFQWGEGSHVMVKQGQSLLPVAVTLLGSEGDDYLLLSDEPLAGREILVSSVSAVQGLLLGLGGE
jgi:hypothetical protein